MGNDVLMSEVCRFGTECTLWLHDDRHVCVVCLYICVYSNAMKINAERAQRCVKCTKSKGSQNQPLLLISSIGF